MICLYRPIGGLTCLATSTSMIATSATSLPRSCRVSAHGACGVGLTTAKVESNRTAIP
jgi:hypothetical protein